MSDVFMAKYLSLLRPNHCVLHIEMLAMDLQRFSISRDHSLTVYNMLRLVQY